MHSKYILIFETNIHNLSLFMQVYNYPIMLTIMVLMVINESSHVHSLNHSNIPTYSEAYSHIHALADTPPPPPPTSLSLSHTHTHTRTHTHTHTHTRSFIHSPNNSLTNSQHIYIYILYVEIQFHASSLLTLFYINWFTSLM